MNRRVQKALALVLLASGAVVAAGSTGVLVADYVRAVRRQPQDKTELARLEKLTDQDASHTPSLDAERARQAEASLARDRQNGVYARVLLAAAVAFVLGGKWLVSLRPQRPPDLLTVLTVRGLPLPERSEAPSVHEAAEHPTPVLVDLSPLDQIVAEHGRSRDAVIPILHAVQNHYRYLPEPALARICECTEISPAQIAGVASFFTQFRRTPTGRHVVKVCHGTACHVAGGQRISGELRRHLGIPAGADTDADLKYTIEPVACMGCCTLAPVAQVDGVTHGHLTAESLIHVLRRDGKQDQDGQRVGRPGSDAVLHDRAIVRIGLGSCCVAGGSARVMQAVQRELALAGVDAVIKRVGCVGMCHNTPLLEAVLPGQPPVLYTAVRPEQVRRIVQRHFPAVSIGRRFKQRLSRFTEDNNNLPKPRERRDPPIAAFLGPQQHIATEHSGRLDPVCLDEYLQHDGFAAFQQALASLGPRRLIEQIRDSGLRGRGGAGFPTAEKWASVRAAEGSPKYVICNGDEGDPGAFMDRMLMESFPYRIIEGLAIAAYAVGARQGYFYIRAEYTLAVERIRDAIRQCEARGYLGENILGSGFSLKLRIMQGAGAFVCGEETALIASIEGRRGTPALRPPYPAERGLWGRPTLVNNVETLANVPWIIRNGAAAFAALGTAASKGTKVFALAGKVQRGGLIEVPMGVTIRQIIEEIGGGMKADPHTGSPRQFKAVQIGGPSGGCVPAELADAPVDYEALTGIGAIMGSGGLVVLDETDCMVDIARYFLSFTQNQSCGKCTYCRVGTRRMLDILDRLCEGKGTPEDLCRLEELAHHVVAGSLCGLGRTAPNPVLTTLRYFREEYEAHIQGRCPAGRCRALIAYRVNAECIGCTLCAQHCPAGAIEYRPYLRQEIDLDRCTRCDVCRDHCPENAIVVESPVARTVECPG